MLWFNLLGNKDNIETQPRKEERENVITPAYDPPRQTPNETPTALEAIRESLSNDLHALEQELREKSGDVHAQVEARKSLAEDLKLPEKLTEIYQEIRSYPAFARVCDSPKFNLCELDDLRYVEGSNEEAIEFRTNDRRYTYTVIYEDEGCYTLDGDDIHDVRLVLKNDRDVELIGIIASKEVDDVVEPFDIDAFQPGEWIKDFLTLYERLQANRHRREIESQYDPEEVSGLKKRFGLSDYHE